MNTQDNNKLIAEFMGYKTYKMNGYLNVKYADNNHRTIQDTHYHTSWDWLMPVSQKIDKYLEDNIGKIGYFDDCLLSNDIDIRYQAVVEFIKQYNK